MDFVSLPVISAFTSSAALTIAEGQIHTLFGVKTTNRDFVPEIRETFQGLHATKFVRFLLCVSCLGGIIFLIDL